MYLNPLLDLCIVFYRKTIVLKPHNQERKMIYDTMQYVFKMDVTELGALNLTEGMMKTDEGIKACQQYAKALTEKF